MKKKILGIGLTGLVGSRIEEILHNSYDFINLNTNTGVDITNPDTLVNPVEDSNIDTVLHLAAKTDVDGCEQDKKDGINGAAWKINVDGTKNVINACKKLQKKIIYISTDFVFDGRNMPNGGYSEEDVPNPQNWYAQTKYEGEKLVRESGLPYVIMRISYPYRSKFKLKKDFLRAIKERLENNQEIMGVTDHIFTPTFIDDIAFAFKSLIEQSALGIYHVVGSTALSPYNAAIAIAKTFNLPQTLIKQTTREEFFEDRAFRPFQLALKNDKIRKLGVTMNDFNKGLQEVKRQLQ